MSSKKKRRRKEKLLSLLFCFLYEGNKVTNKKESKRTQRTLVFHKVSGCLSVKYEEESISLRHKSNLSKDIKEKCYIYYV